MIRSLTNTGAGANQQGWFNIENGRIPDWMKANTGTISWIAWIRPEAPAVNRNRVMWGFSGNHFFRYSNSNYRYLDDTNSQNLAMTYGTAPTTGALELCAVNMFKHPTGITIESWKIGNDGTVVSGILGVPTGHEEATSETFHLGAHIGATYTWHGSFGMLTYRPGVAYNAADMETIWASKKYWAPLVLDTSASGGNAPGYDEDELAWCIPGVSFTRPYDDVSSAFVSGCFYGGTLTKDTPSVVVIETGPGVSNNDDWNRLRGVSGHPTYTTAPTLEDHEDIEPGFWTPDVYDGGAEPRGVSGVGYIPYKMSRDELPAAVSGDRYLAWSNSRGARFEDDNNRNMPGNHAHGFIAEKYELHRGVINAPFDTGTQRWFCVDYGLTAPNINMSRADDNNTLEDFCRFWIMGAGANAKGPGRPFYSTNRSSFQITAYSAPMGTGGHASIDKFVNITGQMSSLFTSGVPATVEFVYMKYPGALDFYWRAYDSNILAGLGNIKASGFSQADTFTLEHDYNTSNGEGYTSGTSVIPTTLRIGVSTSTLSSNGIGVGDVVVGVSGDNLGSIATISGISALGAPSSTITLDSPLHNEPSNGDVFKLGPYSYDKISYTFDPTDETNIYRGFTITNSGNPGTNVLASVFCCVNAYASGVSGFIGGAAGWGGNGYAPQTSGLARGVLGKALSILEVDEVLLFGATQQTSVDQAIDFAGQISSVTSGDVTPIFCGDPQQSYNGFLTRNWATGILEQTGFLGTIVLGSSGVGSWLEQVGRGERQDEAHPNVWGMTNVASGHLALWNTYAILPTVEEIISGGPPMLNRYVTIITSGEPTNRTVGANKGFIPNSLSNFTGTVLNGRDGLYSNTVTSGTNLLTSGLMVVSGKYYSVETTGTNYGDDDAGRVGRRIPQEYIYRSYNTVVTKPLDKPRT